MIEEPSKAKRLTEAEWAEAKALFETGRMTKSDLAKKYGVSRQAISEGMTKRGAVYGSKSEVIEKAAVEAQKDDAQKRIEEITAMKKRQRQFVEGAQGLAFKIMADSIRERTPISDKKADVATIRGLMAIFSKGRDELFHIFDLYRDQGAGDEIPEFIVSEYTPEEIDLLNRARLGEAPGFEGQDAIKAVVDSEAELDDLLGSSEESETEGS